MAENLITQTELENYAPDLDLSAYSATTISGVITRASDMAKKYCNVDGFFKSNVTNERDRTLINENGDLVISFRRRPVADGDVSAIRLVTVDVSQSLTLASSADGSSIYFIPDPHTYLIYPSNFLIAHGTGLISLRNANLFYEIDYTGGYDTDIANLPTDLKEAVTLFARHVINRRLNPTGATRFRQGSVQMEYAGTGKDDLVMEAQRILADGDFVRRVI